jgi:hypothetical protein
MKSTFWGMVEHLWQWNIDDGPHRPASNDVSISERRMRYNPCDRSLLGGSSWSRGRFGAAP